MVNKNKKSLNIKELEVEIRFFGLRLKIKIVRG